jgi:hypothetical protein
MTTTTKNTKKPAGSSKDYDVSDKKIVEMKKGNSYSMITRKTKEELAKEIEEKKEKTAAQQENIQKF